MGVGIQRVGVAASDLGPKLEAKQMVKRESMRFQDVRLKGLGTGIVGCRIVGLVLGTCGTVKAQDARDDAKPPAAGSRKKHEANRRSEGGTEAVSPGTARAGRLGGSRRRR